MIKNKHLKAIYNLVQSLTDDPFTLKKAVLLCCYAEGIRIGAHCLFWLINVNYDMLADIIYLITVLMIASEMGKDDFRRIFVWRNISLAAFIGVLFMANGSMILEQELGNILVRVFPVPENLSGGWIWFYDPEDISLKFIAYTLFTGFSEEVFFRGIIVRKFCRAYPIRKAILLGALLFGLIHLNPWQSVGAFFFGIFIGWIYWRYKSIWLCMFLHASYNGMLILIPFPYVGWHFPAWLDILGVLLFGLGLLMVLVEQGKGRK